MADYIPTGDRDFLAWMQNFLNVATEFKDELGFTPTRFQEIADKIATFNNTLGTAESIRLQSIAATRQKDESRDDAEDTFREASNDAQAVKGAPEQALIGMGLNVSTGERVRRHPVAPTGLTAELEGPGMVHLDWDSGGNTQGVQYVIEMQIDDSEFVKIDAVTRRSYLHENAPTGKRLTYRIRARRRNEISTPSNEASVHM